MTAAAAAPLPSPSVLADRVLPRSLAMNVVLVVAGAALTTVLAQVTIPLQPVPITGQTLAVLLVGASLGSIRGASALALYAGLALVGLPVTAPEDDGSHTVGLAVFTGGTGGYIIGFIAAAALVGWLSERRWDRAWLKAAATFLLGTVVTFAFGLPWLYVVLQDLGPAVWRDFMGGQSVLDATLRSGLYPFIIGGLIKTAIASALLPLAWRAADAIDRRRTQQDA